MRPINALALVAVLALPTMAVGEYQRSKKVLREFVNQNVCPSTGLHKLPCPGYQIDHVWPLKCKGPDIVDNLQWLSVEDHKAKTRREAKECRK